MSGILAVRPASQPSRPFGRPEALRAAAALAFAVGVAALTLPPVDTMARPRPDASPLVETWVQVAIIAAAVATGWVLWRRARWYALHPDASAPGRSRVAYALLTMLTGLAVAGLIPLRHLATPGRVPVDAGAGPAAMILLLAAMGLLVLGASELLPRPRFRHTGLIPRADVPSRRSVAAWPDEVRFAADGSARGRPLLSPLEMACQAFPTPPHAGGYMWNTSTVRSPCDSAAIPAAMSGASRRALRTSGPSLAFRLFLLAVVLAPVLWLLWRILTALTTPPSSH